MPAKLPRGAALGDRRAIGLVFAVLIFIVGDISDAVWFIPAGVLVAIVAIIVVAT